MRHIRYKYDGDTPNDAFRDILITEAPRMASMDMMPDSEIAKAMLRGLEDHLRSKIKERIMAIVQPDIDAAVEEAMQAFKGTIERQRDCERMQTVVRVILEDRRSHKTST